MAEAGCEQFTHTTDKSDSSVVVWVILCSLWFIQWLYDTFAPVILNKACI